MLRPLGSFGSAGIPVADGTNVHPDGWIETVLREIHTMNNIFWIIGVIVVVLAILSFLGLR